MESSQEKPVRSPWQERVSGKRTKSSIIKAEHRLLLKKGVSKLSFEHTPSRTPNFRHIANVPLPDWNCLVRLVQAQQHKAQHRFLNPQTQAQPQAPVKPATHGCKRSGTDVKQLGQSISETGTCRKRKITNKMWTSLGKKPPLFWFFLLFTMSKAVRYWAANVTEV